MLTKEERLYIEMEGVPYSTAIISRDWGIPITNIELVTDIDRQYRGIDYVIQTNDNNMINIDTKYHRNINRIQKRTGYGVDVLSMEIRKRNGLKGWAIDDKLETDYIIDIIKGVGYYMIDAKALHWYMKKYYNYYPVAYSQEGQEDYRAVSVLDMLKHGVILYYRDWHEVGGTRAVHSNDLVNCMGRLPGAQRPV